MRFFNDNILNLIKYYTDCGYSLTHARAKVAQDILLTKISKSNYNDNVTIKCGVVMFNLTNNIRRATKILIFHLLNIL